MSMGKYYIDKNIWDGLTLRKKVVAVWGLVLLNLGYLRCSREN